MIKETSKEDPTLKNKTKLTEDEELATIQLRLSEKESLDRVFRYLCELQNQPSSDDDSKQKKYRREIETKANEKKMKLELSTIKKNSPKKAKKAYKEDMNIVTASSNKITEDAILEEKKGRFGVKAVRKALRTICDEYVKEEMDMMIWEVDENLDGYISDIEFEKMYKRCITDARELQPKKLFYLVQFLMYNKEGQTSDEKKNYITEEDTLELLYIRFGAAFEKVIEQIFK